MVVLKLTIFAFHIFGDFWQFELQLPEWFLIFFLVFLPHVELVKGYFNALI
jgi:hypothetical protein